LDAKFAVTLLTASIDTAQGPVPVQAPVQPVNTDPASGTAVKLTTVPQLKSAVQILPQFKPAGVLFIVPVPVPNFDTVKGYAKVADTVLSEFIVIPQEPVPVHAPAQDLKTAPGDADAVKVTTVPITKDAVHVPAPSTQLIPAGVLVIVPPHVEFTVNV